MTAQEMHIEFDLKYQRLNSSIYRNNLTEEKDWILTLAELQFIKNKTNPKSNTKQEGLQDTQKRYDDIKALIETANLNVYEEDENSVYSVLPYNYLRLLSDASNVQNTCTTTKFTENYKTKATVENIFTVAFPIVDAAKYNIFLLRQVLSAVTTTVYNIDSYAYLASGLADVEERFVLINHILHIINSTKTDYKMYYENYNGNYYQGKLIIVTQNVLYTSFTYELTTGGQVAFTLEATSLNKVKSSDKYTSAYYANRLTKTEDIDILREHSFRKTNFKSPLSILEKDKLIIYHDKSFIIHGSKIRYIRFPKGISVNLNINSELDESVHTEIVDIAVQIASAYSNSTNYRNVINQANLNE